MPAPVACSADRGGAGIPGPEGSCPRQALQCKVCPGGPRARSGSRPGLRIGSQTLAPWLREDDPMATRSWPGLGPVFAFEWLTASRRWQGYALRSSLVLLLLLGLSAVWLGGHDGAGELSIRQQVEIGRAFYAVTTLILLGLVGLAAPAAAA